MQDVETNIASQFSFLDLSWKKLQGILKLKTIRDSMQRPCEKDKRGPEFLVSCCRHVTILLNKPEVLVQKKRSLL